MGKSFKKTTESFISSPVEFEEVKLPEQEEEQKQPGEPTLEEIKKMALAKGYQLKQESKTARLQILITPSNKERIRKVAARERLSVNELLNQIIDEYLRKEGR